MKTDISDTIETTTKANSKESTKERILRCAFEAYAEAGFNRVSLGDIAKRAEIAKPGIFRHYAGKQALLDAMLSRFFDEFCKMLQPIQASQNRNDELSLKNTLISIFEWFTNNNEYFLIFSFTLMSAPKFDETFVRETTKRGITMLVDPYADLALETIKKSQGKKDSLYFKQIYITSTAIFFLFARFFEMQKDPSMQIPADSFASDLTQFLLDGWNAIKPITTERFSELDALCEIPQESFPPENRIFGALARVVAEHGFPGVTVERIAKELGMAKSSLYGYFKNKDELIKELVGTELHVMVNAIYTACAHANNLSEYIYLHMRVQTAYLLKRPSIIPVCGWLRMRGFLPEEFPKDQIKYLEAQFYLNSPLPNVGFPVDVTTIEGWIFSLPISLIIWGKHHKFSDTQIIETLKQYHGFIRQGVGPFSHIKRSCNSDE